MSAIALGARRYAPVALMALLLLAPVLAVPATGPWLGVRTFGLQAVAFGLLVMMLARVNWSVEGLRSFFTTGPNLALVLLVGWAAFSFATTAPSSGNVRDMAFLELLRLGCGAAIFFAAMYRCGTREHLTLWSKLLLGGAIVASLGGLISYADSKENWATAALGNPQLLAAYLVVLLPVAVVFAHRGEMDLRRTLALVATVAIVGALILTRNRSAGLGAAAGLLTVGILVLRGVDFRELMARKHVWLVPALAMGLVVGVFFGVSGLGSMFGQRAKTLTSVGADSTFKWRLEGQWKPGLQMLAQRPLTGQGIGSYPVLIGRYNHSVPSPAQVEQNGPSMANLAHNEPIQLAAELGLVGLGFFLAVLGGFFFRAFRALGRVSGDTRKWILIACIGAVVAYCVDSLGNPAWRFFEVSPILWLVLGIGMAATRTHRERRETGEEAPPPAQPMWRRAGRLGWQMMCVVVGLSLGASAYAANVPDSEGEDVGTLDHCYDDKIGARPRVRPRRRLDFGEVAVGSSRVRCVTVRNVGERGSVLCVDIRIENKDKEGIFRLRDNDNFIRIPAGQEREICVRFVPDKRGEFHGKLILDFGHSGLGTRTIRLTGEGVRRRFFP